MEKSIEQYFATALSNKDSDSAIKEISLTIKRIFPINVGHIIAFTTPHYNLQKIYQSIEFTLRPSDITIIQSPLLIYNDKIIEKGITACAFNRSNITLKQATIENDDPQLIEQKLRKLVQQTTHQQKMALSFLGPNFLPSHFRKTAEMSLGKFFQLYTAGYTHDAHGYAYKTYIDNHEAATSLHTIFNGLNNTFVNLKGFLPLGNGFKITKAINDSGIILEIDNKPAITLYEKYLGEKFDLFKENNLFSFYPIAIRSANTTHMIYVKKHLEDGSLLCIGDILTDLPANLMLFDPQFITHKLPEKLNAFKKTEQGIIFMINSLARKKILKNKAEEEIQAIRANIDKDIDIIGIFADYTMYPNKFIKGISWETGNNILMLWE
ncbi:MAG: FIST C-terminal domain-containing protein [Candidatus Omnitrophica bacterium]|nr:FIST C-terminal domain-containing protein [Candidatus Omnitrophota bacterium]MDD5081275.1 FIST C-terminal domain-containing protein [Candidatus Omnitrophota bacterium]MDD5441087.1 FIST C-terminal domain-containing protein [Candidatus Omnitrophota bacterium]